MKPYILVLFISGLLFFSNSLEDVPEIGLSFHMSTLTMT